MIDPQVLHGGASVWFCIAANELAFGLAAGGASALTSDAGEITTFDAIAAGG